MFGANCPGRWKARSLWRAAGESKHRTVFSRWHDAQADLVRIDIVPGKPGRAQASTVARRSDRKGCWCACASPSGRWTSARREADLPSPDAA